MANSVPATSRVANALIIVDKVMDFIPYVSLINNAITLLAKLAFACLGSAHSSAGSSHPLLLHIQQKSVAKCLFLAVPFLNILVALCHHVSCSRAASLLPSPPPPQQSPVVAALQQQINQQNAAMQTKIDQLNLQKQQMLKKRAQDKIDQRNKDDAQLKKLQDKIDLLPVGSSERQKIEQVYQSQKSLMEKHESAIDMLYASNGI